MKNQRGFTLFEILFVIFWLSAFAFSLWVASLVVRALMKYLGV